MPSIAALTDTESLSALFGSVRHVTVTPYAPSSSATAAYSAVEITLADDSIHYCLLKYTALNTEWIARRTNDTSGREAALLGAVDHEGIWTAFESPYLAFAIDGILHRTRVGVLMHDVRRIQIQTQKRTQTADSDQQEHAQKKAENDPPRDGLRPFVRSLDPRLTQPIDPHDERTLITSLATLHAHYWNHPRLDAPYLTPLETLLEVTGPRTLFYPDVLDVVPATLRARVLSGWGVALCYLARPVAQFLMQPVESFVTLWQALPRTLIHGTMVMDAFVASPTTPGRITASEWSAAAVAPPTIDLGHYIARNSTHHAHSKDEIIAIYRDALEHALGDAIPAEQWEALLNAGIVAGCLATLWEKALAVEAFTFEATQEWAWWSERITMVANKYET